MRKKISQQHIPLCPPIFISMVFDPVHTAVHSDSAQPKAFRLLKGELIPVRFVCQECTEQPCDVGSCRISDCKDIVEVEAIFIRVFHDPCSSRDRVLQLCRERMFRRKPVGVIDHCKSPPGKLHPVILIQFLRSVNPSAAMNQHDHRQFSCLITIPVNVQDIPVSVIPIWDIIISSDICRCCQTCIPRLVSFCPFHSQTFAHLRHDSILLALRFTFQSDKCPKHVAVPAHH